MRKDTTRTFGIHVLTCIAAFSCSGWSQTTAESDHETISLLQQQIKQLQQQNHDLEERIRSLEENQKRTASGEAPDLHTSGPPSSPSTTANMPESPTAQEAPAASVPAAVEMHNLHGIQWRGFAEVDYKILNQRIPETGTYGFVPGSAGNFYTGDFDLFLTSRLTGKASVLSEVDFEEGDAQSYKVDLRRMLLKYDLSDHFKFSFGRYQISTGYYNWAFRSAAWLQTTADRPLVMEFASDGGPLPTQAVGISLTGSIPSGRLGMNYVAEYGSSDTVRPDINGDGLLNDENNGNHVNLGLYLLPDRVPGLRIGGSIYHDQISDLVSLVSGGSTFVPPGESLGPSARWNQTIANGHVVYNSKGIEFLNEGFLIRHALIGGDLTPFNTPAFYSQLSKKLGPIRPFFRYQYINASPRNIIYNDIGLRYGPSFGARYDFNDYFAFKAQFDHTARRGLPDIDGLHFQLAATF
jgi:hypothetical protein